MKRRERILFITRNFPPLVGGMERLAWNTYRQISAYADCDLVGPAGCRDHARTDSRVYECPVRPLARFLASALFNTLRAAITNRYRLVIAGSGMTGLFALLAARLNRAPCVAFVHGLDLIARNRLYQALFVPALRRCDCIIVNSHNTGKLAEAAGIRPERISVLHPGVELPDKPVDGTAFRARHAPGEHLLLSVGRLIPRKGLAEFIRYTLPAIVSTQPQTRLLVIGEEPVNALQATGAVLDEIHAAIAATGLEQHVRLLGRAKEDELAAAYAAADCLVFPLRAVEGDVEGFGMVAVEAAAHGLPTVAFSEGGVSDAIRHEHSGLLVPAGDYAGYGQAVIDILAGTHASITPAACRAFAASFQWDNFGDTLQQIIRECSRGRAGDTHE